MRAKTVAVRTRAASSASSSASSSVAGHDIRRIEAGLARDRLRGRRIVAGDHHDADAGRSAFGDGVGHARRAADRQDRPGRRNANAKSRCDVGPRLSREACARATPSTRRPSAAICVDRTVERGHAPALGEVAQIGDRFGCALGRDRELRRLGPACHTCDIASSSGRSPYARTSRLTDVQVLAARTMQSRRDRESPSPSDRRAHAHSRARANSTQVVKRLRHCARRSSGNARAVARAKLGDRHPVLGQRAGLVGAQHRRRTERLDRRGAAREHARREIRHAPIAMKTVSTTGNSSGSIDMPSAMPASSASSQPPRRVPYSTTARTLTAPPTIAKTRTRRRVCACRRGGLGFERAQRQADLADLAA